MLTLEGLDSVAHYARVLASVRYRNAGARAADGSLQFSSGLRRINVTVFDGDGGSVTVAANVTCVAEPRTGVPGFDPNLPAPPPCSGAGTQSFDPLTGVASCTCSAGYEGDQCEIPPCLAHGVYNPLSDSCACFPPYSGESCSIVCTGGGLLAANSAGCACFAGRGGADCSLTCPECVHGTCTQTGTAVVCGTCFPGWCVARDPQAHEYCLDSLQLCHTSQGGRRLLAALPLLHRPRRCGRGRDMHCRE